MSDSPVKPATNTPRILAFDYLRGFFILIIVVDHLYRWPNLFEFVSGRGELWSSAAQGFVIISGLLVGYIRGYKNRKLPLRDVSKKLVSRGIMLYAWLVITTVALVAASWILMFKGNISYVPIAPYHWGELFSSIFTFSYAYPLTHFLYLYAIFLVISPVMIWLLRRGWAWTGALLSIAGWILGQIYPTEWLQWQILFFLPAIAGFYMDAAFTRYYKLSRPIRQSIRYGSAILALATILLSMIVILPYKPGEYQSIFFSREPISLGTIILSFIWFMGLLSIFQFVQPLLQRYFGWLLLPFGERSLTAYIVHALPVLTCQYFFITYSNLFINTLITAGCVLLTWLILKIPRINTIIPR